VEDFGVLQDLNPHSKCACSTTTWVFTRVHTPLHTLTLRRHQVEELGELQRLQRPRLRAHTPTPTPAAVAAAARPSPTAPPTG